MSEGIIALALLTRRDLDRLGDGFSRAFPVNDVPCFGELLVAIDNADRELHRQRDRERLHAQQSSRPKSGNQ